MSNPSSPSNFEIFQQVLKQQHDRPATRKTAPHYTQNAPTETLPPVEEASTSSSSESEPPALDYVQRRVIQPFVRQTFRWDQELQREVELLEIPNEDWTMWKSLDAATIRRVWVWHQRVFDRRGVKVTDRLLLQAATEISQLLFWDLHEKDAPWREVFEEFPDNISDDGYEFLQRYHGPNTFRKLVISHQSFKQLFFRIWETENKMPMSLLSSINKTLKALMNFIEDIFPGAKKMQCQAYQDAQISYPYAWTIFQPGDIVYEERSIRPFHAMYEQCFRVRRAEDFISRYDGSNVLRLTLEEIIYMPSGFIKSGPRLVLTARHIREYDGLKQITTRDMGIIPFNMVPAEEQSAIRTRLTQRGRRFLHLSTLPFSIWNYKGPLGLVNSIAGRGTMEETRLSLAERVWQIPPIDISENAQSKDDMYIEQSLLICRGYLPAYLLSSSDYAVGILISELSPPLWEQEPQRGLTALSLPDMSHWHALVREFLREGEGLEASLGRRETRGSGLVLALQGPRIVARMVADEISENLQRPLVAIGSTDQDQDLGEASKAALRWGGILFVDHRKVPTDQQAAKGKRLFTLLNFWIRPLNTAVYVGSELANRSLFYPSVLLISCANTIELGKACEDTTDAVISCDVLTKNPVAELWKIYLASELPGFTKAMSDQHLGDICRLLAQLEPREARMGKILKTAKRMAVAERSPINLRNILVIIQSSLSSGDLEKFKDELRAAGLDSGALFH
ncbi:hypothetical protein F66182_1448 [Fusarium sp. NRRL 66182]|nr:hypothetical protein F66182_1448 [Fusarium sp. NRRL 66182]